jgi:hypothetical protein
VRGRSRVDLSHPTCRQEPEHVECSGTVKRIGPYPRQSSYGHCSFSALPLYSGKTKRQQEKRDASNPNVAHVTIRPARHEDDRTFLAIHRASVCGIAAQHYPADIIAQWASPETPSGAFPSVIHSHKRRDREANINVLALATPCIAFRDQSCGRHCSGFASYGMPSTRRAGQSSPRVLGSGEMRLQFERALE